MITSVQNAKVKQWKKLKQRKERKNSNSFLVEGYHLVVEAIQSNWELEEVILQDGADEPKWLSNYEVTYVSDHVLKTITDTKTPQGIAAIIKMRESKWKDYKNLLLIDAVQDPGNLGTIIRTADAAGFSGIVLGEGTVDLYNEKVIRATQGSLFHIDIFQENLDNIQSRLKGEGFTIWASALEDATNYSTVEIPEKVALIVGNEGAGIKNSLLEIADQKVHIPIFGTAESLNVSIATGILLYHIANFQK